MKFTLQSTILLILLCSITFTSFSRKNPTIKIRTDKSLPVDIGDSVTISWTTKYVKQLFCKEISSEELPLEGSIKVVATEDRSYLFIAHKGRKEKRKEFKLDVTLPVFNRINIPETITDEETMSINWDISYAEHVRINGFDDIFPISGKIPLRSKKDTTIIITAYNKFGYPYEIKQKVKVKYVEKLIYPKRVARYGNANISWHFKNTDSVKFINKSGTLPPIGDIYFKINENSKYRLEVYRKDGTFEVRDISISAYDSQIKHFKGDKTFFRGDEISIIWEVNNADSVKLSCKEGIQPLKGYTKYKPESDEVIKITAYLNGVEDERLFQTHMISRKFITGEIDYSKINRNIRLDYEIFSTDLSEFPDIVKLCVLVVDSAGNFVHGLAPPTISKSESENYFTGLIETYIGGKSSKVSDFNVEEIVSKKTVPRNISLVLDHSGSMEESIGALQFSARSFISNKKAHDNLGIVMFDDQIQNYNSLYQTGLVGFGGGTALYAAIGEGIYTIKDSKSVKEIIVFTDGYENSSLLVEDAKAISAIQIAELAEEHNVKITCISFGEYVNSALLEALSAYTGGKYFSVSNEKGINGVWTELPYLRSNYYVITFRTKSVENLNGVKLMYNNNIGEKVTTEKNIYTERPDVLKEVENLPDGYWNEFDSLYNNKTPISLPQAIGFFSFNGTILLEEYEQNVEVIGEQMEKDSTLDVVIFGHTDLVDSDEYNLELSTKRCNWAKDYFIDKGIDEDRVIIIPLGEKYPVHTEEEFDWQAQENRRIEVLLIK